MIHIRRDFLLRMGGLGMGGAFGGMALAPAVPAADAPATVGLLATYVAGTAYHQASAAMPGLRPGDRVDLRREPENRYDPRAVQMRTTSGAMLGYVPRTDNQALCNLMDAGFRLEGRVSSLSPDRRQPEIRVDVLLVLA
jgi:hypothetical protein